LVQRQPPLDESVIADTVEAVFSAPEFDPTRSIWWWTDYLPRIRIEPATARTILLAIVIAMAGVAIARWAYRRHLERRYGLTAPGSRDAGARPRDPWTAAQELAAAGEFARAAHALYFALLESLAGREQVHLHPSKTTGDYVRELRARSSALLPGVRDFARSYEPIAYGDRPCEPEDWARLESLASAVIRPNRAMESVAIGRRETNG
jgi:hypothetical protein